MKNNNKSTRKNSDPNKFLRKNEDIPTSKKSQNIESDVLGSYTGVPENEYDTPVQDADDL